MPAPDMFPKPTILPLGDCAVLVRFGSHLTDAANRAAIALSSLLERDPVPGVVEVMPNLVSVLLRFDPMTASPAVIQGELRLRLFGLAHAGTEPKLWVIPTVFDGPDVDEVASALNMTPEAFITAHNAAPLRVLATGFAPGFVYCGMHEQMVLPRRTSVRPSVPSGSVLFAAGQTAITATDMPTGWHVIGRTEFRNFEPRSKQPTLLRAGDLVRFEVVP